MKKILTIILIILLTGCSIEEEQSCNIVKKNNLIREYEYNISRILNSAIINYAQIKRLENELNKKLIEINCEEYY